MIIAEIQISIQRSSSGLLTSYELCCIKIIFCAKITIDHTFGPTSAPAGIAATRMVLTKKWATNVVTVQPTKAVKSFKSTI